MNYNQFLEEVSEVLYKHKNWDSYYAGPKALAEKGLWCYWTTGGLQGGNCWGDDADSPVEPQPEQDLEGLDEILEKFTPNMSFLQYRQIEKLIEYQDRTEWRYYGNYTSYREKKLDMKKLFDFLCDKGYIQRSEE